MYVNYPLICSSRPIFGKCDTHACDAFWEE